MTTAWYVLRSKPHKEEFLWGQVLAHQVDAFFPAIRSKAVNPRARKVKPYFPGYLFVNVDMDIVPLSLWMWLPGSRGLVSFDSVPALVPDPLIAAIRRKVNDINENGNGYPPSLDLKTGDIVSIQSGPFTDYDGIFDGCVSGNDRVRVLLKHLKDSFIPIELPVGQVERKKQSV
jgi:transcription antitermination factor NusG